MSANPVANGALLTRDLDLPDIRGHGVDVVARAIASEATTALGGWLRGVAEANPTDFLLFGPDEEASNRLREVIEVSGRKWYADIGEYDERFSADGRVVEVLSEHVCEGLLEGYLLTGRHGVFTSTGRSSTSST